MNEGKKVRMGSPRIKVVRKTARHQDEMNQEMNKIALGVIEQFDLIRKMLIIRTGGWRPPV